MSGRNRMPGQSDGFRGYHDGHRPVMNRRPGPIPIHPAALEEELEIQHREMQRIIVENRLVIDDNTILQRELTAAKEEIHRLGKVIPKVQAEKGAQTRELIERGLKLEADLQASEPLRAEVMQLRAEQLIAMRSDIDGMCKELVEARRAYEYEKKANEEELEQKQVMEKNLISMAREIEQLRTAERLNSERRRGLGGGGGYGMLNRSPEMRYPSAAYGDGYGSAWGPYDKHGPPRR
ncbi:Protein FLX-like [Quillaja saponaria]|uniref:Protein FLX-like n=1 Tax=Quillaja saponaria TaxID=32244 RepID=A0AAD7P5U4_QUISA|nr:Protein FLX-like [Quillaja saponaria]